MREPGDQEYRRPRRWHRGGVAAAAWLCLLLPPAPGRAAEATKPESGNLGGGLFARIGRAWVVDAPGAAGARYGLGIRLFFEHQESLRFVAAQTAVSLPSRNAPTVVPGDPGLLGRKFDLTWEMTGLGVEVPVALPSPGGAVFPTLVFQAGGGDFELEFGDRTRGADSVSYSGQGLLWGVGADLAAPLCTGCPWVAFAGFRHQELPETEADRSPPFDAGGGAAGLAPLDPQLEVLTDETRLRREVQEVSARIAYGAPGARVLPYAGVRHRWTEVEVEDELAFRGVLGDTGVESRTRLEGEPTLGLAGVDFQLGRRLYGSFETAVGDEDWGTALRVVLVMDGTGGEGELDWGPENSPEPKEAQDARSLEIATALARRLEGIHAAFLAGRESLTRGRGPDGEPAFLLSEVEALLGRTEADLIGALAPYPELEALRDWVRDRFAEAGEALAAAGEQDAGRAARATTWTALRRLRPAELSALPGGASLAVPAALPEHRSRLAQSRGGRAVPERRGNAVLDGVGDVTATLARRASNGRLQTYLVFTTNLDEGTRLRVHPRFNPSAFTILPRNPPDDPDPVGGWVYIGSYSFEVRRERRILFCEAAPPGDPDSAAPCPLDLVSDPPAVLCCTRVECRPWRCP